MDAEGFGDDADHAIPPRTVSYTAKQTRGIWRVSPSPSKLKASAPSPNSP